MGGAPERAGEPVDDIFDGAEDVIDCGDGAAVERGAPLY